MKPIPMLTAAALATFALAACDRPATKAGSNTPVSGSTTTVVTSTPGSTVTSTDSSAPSSPTITSSTTTSTTTTAPSTDTASTTAATGAHSMNAVSDTLITGKVKAAITADNGMKDADISVKTENGNVTLTGSVKSPEQVTLAAALAQRQEGVNRVENQVAVK